MKCSFIMVAAAAAALLLTIPSGLARPTDEAAPAAKSSAPAEKKKGNSNVPFRGHVGSVDSSARTVTLAGKKKERVLHVTDETRLEREGKAVGIGDIRPGDYARGLVTRDSGGNEVLVKATFGEPPADSARSGESTPETASAGR